MTLHTKPEAWHARSCVTQGICALTHCGTKTLGHFGPKRVQSGLSADWRQRTPMRVQRIPVRVLQRGPTSVGGQKIFICDPQPGSASECGIQGWNRDTQPGASVCGCTAPPPKAAPP